MRRGEIWWASLSPPTGSEPGYRRPVLIIQSDNFNRGTIRTVICLALTTNLGLREAPGNVFVSAAESGLARDSVINVSQALTINRTFLTLKAGRAPSEVMARVNDGIRLVLSV